MSSDDEGKLLKQRKLEIATVLLKRQDSFMRRDLESLNSEYDAMCVYDETLIDCLSDPARYDPDRASVRTFVNAVHDLNRIDQYRKMQRRINPAVTDSIDDPDANYLENERNLQTQLAITLSTKQVLRLFRDAGIKKTDRKIAVWRLNKYDPQTFVMIALRVGMCERNVRERWYKMRPIIQQIATRMKIRYPDAEFRFSS